MADRFVVLGNPESNRVSFFQKSLLRCQGQSPARVVSWLGFLRGEESLTSALQEAGGDAAVWLRIESTGKNPDVERELIALGAEHRDLGAATRIDSDGARSLEEDTGRIRYLRQRHLGFLEALTRVETAIARVPVKVMSPPRAIALMFDKPRCHARCEELGVPVPKGLGSPDSYAALREAMKAAGLRRVFVKPAHSSSASGVIALAVQGAKVAARTSVELERGPDGEVRLYNSRKIRRYSKELDVALIVDTLCREGVQVEEWVPKASLEGKTCDLRIVVIGGRAQHTVVRTSESPMTNLHLKNPRGDLETFKSLVGEEGWTRVRRTAEQAAEAVAEGAIYAGVDVAVARGLGRDAVLEVNAFGDLLPRVLVDGRDTYAAEIHAALGDAA